MSDLNEQLNSVEKREEYIINIPIKSREGLSACCVVWIIIALFIDILLLAAYIIDPNKNSWAFFALIIIDLPLTISVRFSPRNTANGNSSPTHKKLKLFKDQNDSLVIDIDNTKYSYPIVNVDKFSYFKKKDENEFVIIIKFLDGNKTKLIHTYVNPSISICDLNDYLNKLKVNITPKIY